ncbi:MAG: Arm DNA-binding domain-containing protein [Peptostreptococcaceae bacterium]|nr:Arm DNA-binding domain-containing protein [Peptostreptococcaceae bacterium]
MQHNIHCRQKDGGIQAIISYRYDNDLKWRSKSKQGFKKRSDAMRWANEIVVELAKNEGRQMLDDKMTLGDAIEIFLQHKERTVKTNTYLSYVGAFKHFAPHSALVLKRLTSVKADSINATLPPSYATIVNGFWSFLERKKLIRDLDIDTLRYKTIRKGKVIPYSDYLKIAEVMAYNPQYAAFCKIAYRFGLRAGEILGLTPDAVQKNKIIINKQWTIISKQGNKRIKGLAELKNKDSGIRELPSTPDILTTLQALPFNFREGRYFSIQHQGTLRPKMLPFGYTPHDFRHTRASEMVNEGFNLRYVAYFLGDTLETVISKYVSLNDDMILEQNKKFLTDFCRSE